MDDWNATLESRVATGGFVLVLIVSPLRHNTTPRDTSLSIRRRREWVRISFSREGHLLRQYRTFRALTKHRFSTHQECYVLLDNYFTYVQTRFYHRAHEIMHR